LIIISAQSYFGNPKIPELIEGILIEGTSRSLAISRELTRQLARRSLDISSVYSFHLGPTV